MFSNAHSFTSLRYPATRLSLDIGPALIAEPRLGSSMNRLACLWDVSRLGERLLRFHTSMV